MWSLGATLYAAVEGHTPYARPTVVETLTALATEPPNPTRKAGPLKVVIEGLLRRDPGARLRPTEVERMLQRAAVGAGVPAQRDRRSTDTFAPPPQVLSLPAGRQRWTILGLSAVGVLALIATATLTANRPDSNSQTQTPTFRPSTFVNRAAGVMNCENPPAQATLVEPGRPGPPDVTNPLLNGFTWFGTPGSWFVGVHEGWQTWRDGDVTCFSDPRGGRVLAIDPTRPPADNPMKGGQTEEKRLRDAGLLPEYHLVHLESKTVSAPAAEWEFTFGSSESRRHAAALLIQVRDRIFVVYWATDDIDFMPSRPFYDIVRTSFRPGPPQRPPGEGPPPTNGTPPPSPASPPPWP